MLLLWLAVCLWLFVVLEWHSVEFGEVLLDLKLAQEGRAAEADLIWSKGLVSTRKNHFMANKVDRGARFLETRCDCWLDALWAQILLKLQSFLIVFSKLVHIILACLGRRLEVTMILRGQVADLLWVTHLEVDLIWVKAESFHL